MSPLVGIESTPPGAQPLSPLLRGGLVGVETAPPEELVGTELQGTEALAILRARGPGAELDYLDQKHNNLEKLDFTEWKRREELLDAMSFSDRHFSRSATAVGDALSGLWDTATRATKEAAGLVGGLFEGKISPMEAMTRMNMTGAEAGVLGAVDFTELVKGVANTMGGPMDMYGRENTAEEWQKVGFEHYNERQDARRYRAQLGRDTAIGTVAGGLQVLGGGSGDLQPLVAGEVMPALAEGLSMVSPTNPLNVIPFGVGGKAATLGSAGLRGASVAAERTALAAGWLRQATDIGALVETGVRKLSPGISDASAATARRAATGLAWSAATGAGAVGIGTDDSTLTTIAAAFAGVRGGLFTAAKSGEFLSAVARQAAQGPRLQSTLARVARDPAVPGWAASTARALEKAGATPLGRGARAAALGGATAGAVSAGLAGLAGGEEQDVAAAGASGAVFGAGLGIAGQLARGGDTALRVDTERMLLGESQRERGGDAAANLFYGLPISEQLAMGTIQAIAGPSVPIEIVSGADFAAQPGTAGGGGGVFLPTQTLPGQLGRILINADAKRPAGMTALHEFAHAMADRQNPLEVKAYVQSLASPEQLASFERAYLGDYLDGRPDLQAPAAESFDELGFPVRNDTGASQKEASLSRAREELLRTNGPDWLFHEFFAERGAETLSKVDLAKAAQSGEWEPLAARSLRVKQGVLHSAGVAFEADGRVIDAPGIGEALNAQGEKALGSLLNGYVKELGEYAPRLDTEVKKQARADSGKGPPLPLGKNGETLLEHPAFKNSFSTLPNGVRENEFARVAPNGKVEPRPVAEVKRTLAQREADLARLFPRGGPKVERADPLVGRRIRDDGREEVSGTVMPRDFYQSSAFSTRMIEIARTLQTLMNETGGETAEHWYHQIGTGGNNKAWTANVRGKLGNIGATAREVRPLSFLVSEANNLGVRVLDMMAMKAKALDYAHGDKLTLWAGNLDAFNADLKTMLGNWAANEGKGVPGETGIGSAKHQFLLDFLGKDSEKNSLIKTFRLDRMEDVRPSGRTGFTFDYSKFKRRLRPDVNESQSSREPAAPSAQAPPGSLPVGGRYRVEPSTDGGTYREAIARTAAEHKLGAAVEVKDPEFYKDPGTSLFMSEDRLGGVAVSRDGDLVSVFKHPTSTAKIDDLLAEAAPISVTLDGFDVKGFLPNLYAKHGFCPAARVKFNREFAPDGWPYELAGEPDVVMMVRDEDGITGLPEITDYNEIRAKVPLFEDYDAAKDVQDAARAKVIAASVEKAAMAAQTKPGGIQTGVPAAIEYIHNTEKAPDLGPTHGQDIEPAGKYVNLLEGESQWNTVTANAPGRYQRGSAKLKNPLVVNSSDWKRNLARRFGATGEALAEKLRKAGHDAIVTMDKYGPGEVVLLGK